MNEMMNDLASWTYVYNILVAAYGFTLFLYWAIKRRGASSWYVYVMSLMLSTVVTASFQVYARYLLLNNDAAYDSFIMSFAWAAKSWINSIVLTCIGIHATWRLCKA